MSAEDKKLGKARWAGHWQCSCGAKGTAAEVKWLVKNDMIAHECPKCGARVVLQ
jgi:hypothetical protein